MIFLKPIPFEQALNTSKAKLVLQAISGNSKSTRELDAMGPALRRRALVLAQQENAQLAAAAKSIVEDILEGRETQEGGRHKLSQWFDSTGYEPDAAKAGGIEDLGSSARMNLILRTETQMAVGYGEWKQGQTDTLVNMWPAQELFRAESRKEERDWPERWRQAGGQFFEGAGDGGGGRMIALKSDPIWREINRFDNAWAPFDFNSGMDVRDIDREESEFLGLIEPGQMVVPQRDSFSDKIPFPNDLPDDIRRELERELANEFFANGFCPTGEGGGVDNSCGGDGAVVHTVEGRKFELSPVSKARGEKVVMADVAKLDAAWKKDGEMHIAPGKEGKRGARDRMESFLAKGETIEMSQVFHGEDDPDRVGFINGRHRFSVLRDKGVKVIPVAVDKKQEGEFRRRYGAEPGAANERHNGGRPTQRGGSAPYPRPAQGLVDKMLTKARELNALTFEPLLRVVDTVRLQPSQWGDKEANPSLSQAVAEDPASVPPLLVQVWGNGVFRVLDGHHRLKAARAEGRSKLWCVVIDAGYLK